MSERCRADVFMKYDSSHREGCANAQLITAYATYNLKHRAPAEAWSSEVSKHIS